MSLLVTAGAEPAFEQAVRSLLPKPSSDSVERWDRPLKTVADVEALAGLTPAVVVLGPGLAESTIFEVARLFDRVDPTISVLVVAQVGPDTWREALGAGVRAVISPDTTEEDLRVHLEQAFEVARRRQEATGAASPSPRSRVITVVSPKGGSGKTIISTNLAVGLAAKAPGEVVLIDLDLQFGDVAYALGVAPQQTIADAASALGELDATTLKLFLTRHPSGLWALCAPHEPAVAETVSPAVTTAVIHTLASQFRWVVIDTAPGLGEHTLAALDLSTDVVLVAAMDVPSVRNLRKAMEALDALGMTSPSRHFVLNRADSRVELDKEDVAAAAGIAIDLEIPSSRHVPISLNEGRPLVISNPRSPAARSIAHFVERLSATPSRSPQHRRGGGR